MIIDDPVIAAEHAAAVAEHAADAAADAAVAAAAEPPQPNPDALIAADVAIATEQETTERARIEGRTAVRIAELQQEEPPWLNDIRASLTRLETTLEALIANPLQSTPQPSVVITQDSPTTAAAPNSAASEGGLAAVEPDPEPAAVEPEAVAPEPAAAPARRGPRWI